VPQGVEGELKDIFDLQKRFVFNIIDSMGITLTVDERDAIAKVPTESYLAFLAYCRGLDYRRRGMESAAHTEFNNAVEIDAGFDAASTDAEFTIGGSLEQSFETLEGILGQGSDIILGGSGLDSRLTNVLANSGIIPGIFGDGSEFTLPSVNSAMVIIQGDLDAN
jgi:hypothetical protein